MGAFCHAFALLDAVGDLDIVEADRPWLGFILRECRLNDEEENEEFLYDELYEAYGDWLELSNKGE